MIRKQALEFAKKNSVELPGFVQAELTDLVTKINGKKPSK